MQTQPTQLVTRDDVPTVAVVGAGLAGLAAATLLADRGLDVHLFEGSAVPGGRARTTTTDDGHHRNLGPHALYLRGPGKAVLGRLGIDPAGRSPKVQRTRWWDGGTLRRASGLADVRAMVGIVNALRKVDPTDPGAGRLSVADWAGQHGLDPLRTAATSRISTYAADLDATSVGLLAERFRASPVRYLDGGWQSLVEALRARAVAAGAHVHLAGRVVEVVGEERVERVVLADGREVDVEAAVLAVGGPDRTADLLGTDAAARLRAATEGTLPVRAACLDVALAPGPRGVPIALGLDRPDYLSDHGVVARLAPDGGTVVHVARYLATGTTATDEDRAALEELLDATHPGWRDRLVDASWRPAMVVTHDLAPVARGGLLGRTRPDAAGIEGLRLAGDWVGTEGHLADASLASAARAADEVADLLDWSRRAATVTGRAVGR